MGDRGQIAIKDREIAGQEVRVYLYGHWAGSELPDILKQALIRGKNRWDDSCYLTRIIFCEMVKGHEMDEPGFGIDCAMHGDVEHPVPILDCDTQMITWEGPDADEKAPVSFADFIKS
jgi:hypothetical protein